MSDSLLADVPFDTAVGCLEQLQTDCDSAPATDVAELSRGPFGVFRLIQPPSSTGPAPETSLQPSNPPTDSTLDEQTYNALDAAFSPTTQALLDSICFQPDLWDLHADTGLSYDQPDLSFDFNTLATASKDHSGDNDPIHSHGSNAVPQDAAQLINHYAANIVPLFTPFRHNKTPWQTLFLPLVKSCLASLVLGETTDEASLCMFYGTLAISASSLAETSNALNGNTESWASQAQSYKAIAYGYAGRVIEAAYTSPKMAKYKTILMALLTMVHLSRLTASHDETEYLFLETEKLIRLRGLNRRKSRKVRLLHHCCVFERLFYESTLSKPDRNRRAHVVKAIEASGVLARGQDSPAFVISKTGILQLDLQRQKSREEGENDLHLEHAGDFPASLYPDIYGVPESYMVLLSAIIRLGKEKDVSERTDVDRAASLAAFMAQAKSIEKTLKKLKPGEHTSDSHSYLPKMLTALWHALAIHFYRKVYDLDTTLLQDRVMAISNLLMQCQATCSDSLCGSTGFVWPAFIAACEAESEQSRAVYTSYFHNLSERSGFELFKQYLVDLKEIWAQ